MAGRISTAFFNTVGVLEILRSQEQLSTTQLQIATGKRILQPEFDPAGAAQALDLREFIRENESFQNNITFVKTRNQLEETVLVGTKNLLQRVKELSVQAATVTADGPQRFAIAKEIEQLNDELFNIANTKDANNEFLFSGSLGNTQPFTDNNNGSFTYNGDQTVREIQIGSTRRIDDGNTGAEVFFDVANGNGVFQTAPGAGNTGAGVIDSGSVTNAGAFPNDTFTLTFAVDGGGNPVINVVGAVTGAVVTNQPFNGVQASVSFNGVQVNISGSAATGDTFTIAPSTNQDIFTTLSTYQSALENFAQNGDQVAFGNASNRAFADFDQALTHILNIRSTVGARLNAADTQTDINADFLLQIQASLSDVEDLDIAEAASRLNLQTVALQAAQQSFIKVQNLSLFNFL
ncbi:MAG: flagellar hook-associated protein FlgL [Methylococcales bacterium]|jgi:flagellar hook-associated protein 3 FlgL|nr:flagellar hook-associated protein FlgL [Methylococcales bacterium]MBT7444509.1 flagellar hook-associated protein FlgL [Methylococcales bacterium]